MKTYNLWDIEIFGIVAMVAGAVYYKEHTSSASPGKRNKHEKEQSRKKRDNVGEKGEYEEYQERINGNKLYKLD